MATDGFGGAQRSLVADAQLIQDYLQSPSIPVSLENNGDRKVVPFQNVEGQAEAFAIDVDGAVFHVCRQKQSDSGWNVYGIGAGFKQIAGVDSATVWGVGYDGAVWQNHRGIWTGADSPSGPAQAISAGTDRTLWALDPLGNLFVAGPYSGQAPTISPQIAPALMLDASGRLNFFCVDADGNLWTAQQSAWGCGWRAWKNLGNGQPIARVEIAPNADGRLQAFAIGSDFNLWTAWQQTLGGNWSGWWRLGSSPLAISTLAVGQNQDGRLEVFSVAQATLEIQHMWQLAPNQGWSDWTDWGAGAGALDLAVALASNGCLALAAIYLAGDPATITTQTQPGGRWGPPQPIGGPVSIRPIELSKPLLARNADGHLELFTLTPSGNIYHTWETQGVWTGDWADFGNPGPSGLPVFDYAVASNQDGRLELFTVSVTGVSHIWQTTPNGTWSDWSQLQAPAGAQVTTQAVACDPAGLLNLIGLTTPPGSAAIVQRPDGNWGGWTGWASNWRSWYPVSPVPALAGAPVGAAADFWAITQSGDLAHYSSGACDIVSAPGEPACLAADQDSTVYLLTTGGALFAQPSGAAEFVSLTGNLAATSIGVTSATIVAMSANSGLNRWRQDGWQAVNSPVLIGDSASWAIAPQVSVGVDGTAWVLDGTGSIWKQGRIGPSIAALACPAPEGTQLRSLSAAPAHAVWGIDANGAVLRSLGGAWSMFSNALPSGPAAQASSRADGSIFAIDAMGAPYQYVNNAWEPLNGGFDGPLVQSPTMWAATAHSAFNEQGLGQWVCLLQEFDKTITQISAAGDGTVVALLTDGTLAPVENPNAPILTGAPADLVQIAVVNADCAWALTQDPAIKRYSLYLFSEGGWSLVPTTLALLSGDTVIPQLGSASDGTTWLLDTNGVPRQLTYSPEKVTWNDKTRSTTFQSVSAVTASAVQTTTAEMHEAWAVTTEGEFRRSFGEAWRDAGMALPNGATATRIFAGGYSWLAALDQQNNLYRDEAQTQLPKAPGLAIGVMAAGQDGGGGLYVFTLNGDGQVWVAGELPGMAGGAPIWADFQQLSAPQAMTNVIAGQDQDGTLEVFCIGTDGLIYHAWQDRGSGGWSAFWQLGETGQPPGVQLTALASGRDAGKLLCIFALGDDGSIWRIVQQPSSTTGWSGWTAFPAGPSGPFFNLAVGNDPGGALEVFATDEQFIVRHAWQDPQSATGWSGWWQLGSPGVFGAGVSQGQVAAGVGPDGVLHVFAISFDGRNVYEIHGQPPGWSDWTVVSTFSALWAVSLAVGTGANGAFTLFVQGSDGAIYASLRQADGNWSPHAPIGAMATDGEPLGSLTVANGGDGVLQVFAAGTVSVWRNRPQPDSPTGWGDWGRLSGPQSWTRFGAEPIQQLVGNASGGFYALFQDGTLHWSSSGTDWSAMPFPGGGAPSQAALSVSAGIDGTLWAVTADTCYRNDSEQGAWQAVGAGSFSAAPVGSGADLWSLDPDWMVWRSANGGATWWREPSVTAPTRQLSICSDGSVWRLDADGTTSLATAWERLMRPTGMAGYALPAPAIGVDTIVDKWGKRLLLIAGQDGLFRYSYEAARDVWTPISAVPGMTTNGWGAIRTPINDDVLLYCFWNETNTVSTALWSEGQFTSTAVDASEKIVDLDVTSDADHLYWIVNGDRGISIAVTTGEDFSQLNFQSLNQQAPSVARFLNAPWGRSARDVNFLLADGDGQIWVGAVTGALTGNPTADYLLLTGPGDVQPNGPAVIAPMLQARRWNAPQPRVYVLSDSAAVPGTNVLWAIARGNLFKSAADSSAWNRWVPLAGSYFNAYPGSADAALDTMFVVDSAGNLGFVRQDATSGQWQRGLTQRPSWAGADIIEIASYSSEITILGANGAPEPNLAVTIFADWPVDAWINNTLHRLDPVEAVTVTPDRTGRIRFKCPVAGLTFPKLTLQAEGLGGLRAVARTRLGDGGATVDPPQRIFGYLSGTGTLPVNGGQPSQFSSGALLDARPDGQAFAKLSSTADAAKAYSTITQTAGLAQNAASPEGVAAWLRPAVPRAVGSSIADFFDDLGHGLETAADFMINGVEGAAIQIVDGAVQFTITLANGVETVINWVVKTAEDALAAIEAIAVLVIDDLEKFIDWLKLLFDWGNILKTQTWLKQVLQQVCAVMPGMINNIEGIAQAKFQAVQQQFDIGIGQLIDDGNVGGYQSFADLPSSYSDSSSAPRAEAQLGDGNQPISGSSSVHNNWLFDHVIDHLLPSFSIPPVPGAGNPFASFDANNALDSLRSAAQKLIDFLQTLVEDPNQLATQGIVDLLEAGKYLVDAAVELIDDLIKTLLQFASSFFQGLISAMDSPIHIPLLGELFQFLTGGEELTLFDLLTLIIAAPAYILSMLIFGVPPYDGLTEAPSGAIGGRTAAEAWAAAYLVFGLQFSFNDSIWDFLIAAIGPNPGSLIDKLDLWLLLPAVMANLALLKQVASWPSKDGFPNRPTGSGRAWDASYVNYAVSWLPPLLGWAFTGSAVIKNQTLPAAAMQILKTLIGCIGTIGGVGACWLGHDADPPINPATRAKLAIKSLPLLFSIVMVPGFRAWVLEAIYVDPAWLMLVFDLLINVSTAILDEVGANT